MKNPTEAWSQIITELSIWHDDPDYFADEEFTGPSPQMVYAAIVVARVLHDLGHPAPHRVVPDGEGGIVFEGLEFGEIHIWADGDVTSSCDSDQGSRIVFVRPEVVDRHYALSSGTARRLARRGLLPHHRLPDGSIRFRLDEVAAVVVAVPGEVQHEA